jgi:hypothetical protein
VHVPVSLTITTTAFAASALFEAYFQDIPKAHADHH